MFIHPQFCLSEQLFALQLEEETGKGGAYQDSLLRLNQKNLYDYLIGRKFINGRKLEPFGEVCGGPPGQL